MQSPHLEPAPAELATTLERLDELEGSLERYGCFDLIEDDVAWLIRTLRKELRRRSADT